MASVGEFTLRSKTDNSILLRSNSLINQSLNFKLTEKYIKGGLYNKTLGMYFTDPILDLTLTDSLFSIDNIALVVGENIKKSGTRFTTENVVVDSDQSITISKYPKSFNKEDGVGWICCKTSRIKIQFENVDGQGKFTSEWLQEGDHYCVEYLIDDTNIEQLIVNEMFVPMCCYATIKFPLFRSNFSLNSSDKLLNVGYIECIIPNLQLLGNLNLSITSDGSCSVPIQARALATSDDGETNYYAKINRIFNDEIPSYDYISFKKVDYQLRKDYPFKLQLEAVNQGLRSSYTVNPKKYNFKSNDEDNLSFTIGEEYIIITASDSIRDDVIIDCLNKETGKIVSRLVAHFEDKWVQWGIIYSFNDDDEEQVISIWDELSNN